MSDLENSNYASDETIERFWNILHQSGPDPKKLRSLLMTLPEQDVFSFAKTFFEMACELKDPSWQHVDPDTSEDGMDDISQWVVSQGKEYYTYVLEHPETVPKYKAQSNPGNVYYEAEMVYEERFSDVPDFVWDTDSNTC